MHQSNETLLICQVIAIDYVNVYMQNNSKSLNHGQHKSTYLKD